MSAAGAERQLVVFSLHGEDYGLPITAVREITHYTPPGATATAHGLIAGMISWRGTVLPVADLSSRLGGQLAVGERTRILVLELRNGSLGLVVDAVVGVLRIPEAQIAPLPVAAVGDRLIVLIDPERALGGELPSRAPQPRRKTAAKPAVRRQGRSGSSRRPAT